MPISGCVSTHGRNPPMPEDAISRLPDLMEAFEFTAEDLDYNRRGLISPEQHLRIGEGISSRVEVVLAAVNLGLFCGCPTAFAVVALDRSNPLVAVALLVVIVILLRLGYITARRMLRSSGAMRRAIAQDAAGGKMAIAHVHITEDEAGEHVVAIDDAHAVELYHDAFKRLDRSHRYRVYYLPESKILFSIEADAAQSI
jgi:hypothetical protein